jgi:hypothetical protein
MIPPFLVGFPIEFHPASPGQKALHKYLRLAHEELANRASPCGHPAGVHIMLGTCDFDISTVASGIAPVGYMV